MHKLPNGGKFKKMYSGGEKHRKGVTFLKSKKIIKSVVSYQTTSERHITLTISGRKRDLFLHQIYAPNLGDADEQVESSYKSIKTETKQ